VASSSALKVLPLPEGPASATIIGVRSRTAGMKESSFSRIANHESNIREQWAIIGDRLLKLREENLSDRGFRAAIRNEGIELTRKQIAAAQ
jgi:hypothetical protein